MSGSARRMLAEAYALGVSYEDGYFTYLIRRHNWPPRFESQFSAVDSVDRSAVSSRNRMNYLRATGNTGSITGLGLSTALKGEAALRKVMIHAAR